MKAPQMDCDYDVEGSIPLGGNGEKVLTPSNNNAEFNVHRSHVSSNNVGTTMTRSQKLDSSANPKESSDSSVRVSREDGITAGKNEDDDDRNKEMEKPEEAPASLPSTSTQSSIRWLIIIGVMSASLLVGLIAGVSVAFTRDKGNTGAGGTDGAGNDDSASLLSTGNPDDLPSSDTTLGLIYNEGILRCGVAIEARGFASTNPKTGRMEGFDADLCRAVAAGIFGPDNLDDRVEFVPTSAVERWRSLQGRKSDVLALVSTHTMEREVFEVRWRNSSHGILFFLLTVFVVMFARLPHKRVTRSRSLIFTMDYNLLEFLNMSFVPTMPISLKVARKPKSAPTMGRLMLISSCR
jgi:hypothetical protein